MRGNQKGFHLTSGLLFIAAISVIAFIGWYVYKAQQDGSNQPSQPASNGQSAQIPQVKKSADLADAESYLINTDIDKELDTAQIDSVLNQ